MGKDKAFPVDIIDLFSPCGFHSCLPTIKWVTTLQQEVGSMEGFGVDLGGKYLIQNRETRRERYRVPIMYPLM